jgi:hypothetical protein
VPYADDVGSLGRPGRGIVIITVVACTVGVVAALASRDTWQRALVTTLIYGVAAALLFSLVSLRSDKPRIGVREGRLIPRQSRPRPSSAPNIHSRARSEPSAPRYRRS